MNLACSYYSLFSPKTVHFTQFLYVKLGPEKAVFLQGYSISFPLLRTICITLQISSFPIYPFSSTIFSPVYPCFQHDALPFNGIESSVDRIITVKVFGIYNSLVH